SKIVPVIRMHEFAGLWRTLAHKLRRNQRGTCAAAIPCAGCPCHGEAVAGTSKERSGSGTERGRVPASQTKLVIGHAVLVIPHSEEQCQVLCGLPVIFEEEIPIVFMLTAMEENCFRIIRPALLRRTIDVELFLETVDRAREFSKDV